LHTATRYGNLNVVRILLSHGARQDACNRNLDSPLHVAVGLRHYEIASLLVETSRTNHQSVDVCTLLNAQGETPLDLARRKNYAEFYYLLRLNYGSNRDEGQRNTVGHPKNTSTPQALSGQTLECEFPTVSCCTDRIQHITYHDNFLTPLDQSNGSRDTQVALGCPQDGLVVTSHPPLLVDSMKQPHATQLLDSGLPEVSYPMQISIHGKQRNTTL
uniref:ANK_REP_REGION domain-containing protein n=1 Tax=Echinostoma caproni TaxID=27848 RepID=A0A183BCV0_9TREM